MLLSWFVCQELGILPKEYPEPVYAHVDTIATPVVSVPSKSCHLVCSLPPGEITSDPILVIRTLLCDAFADVFDTSGLLRPMTGPAMRIYLKEDAVPFAVNGARLISFAQHDEVKRMLDSMVDEGVIALVSNPTE